MSRDTKPHPLDLPGSIRERLEQYSRSHGGAVAILTPELLFCAFFELYLDAGSTLSTEQRSRYRELFEVVHHMRTDVPSDGTATAVYPAVRRPAPQAPTQTPVHAAGLRPAAA